MRVRTAQYRWNDCGGSTPVFRLCYSEKLGVMLPHAHGEIEFMYFYHTDGCVYSNGGKNLLLHTGDLAVVDAGRIHSCEQWGEKCSAVCIIVDTKKLHTPLLTNLCFAECIRADAAVASLFDELKQVLFDGEQSEPERACRISALVYLLLGIVAGRAHPREKKQTHAVELAETVAYIEQNLSEELSAAKLAKRMNLSTNRFYHIFKEYTGMSPTEYINARRIEKACGYLADTDMTIAAIAQECRFCTSSYFCEKFKACMQITPLAYRRDPVASLSRV